LEDYILNIDNFNVGLDDLKAAKAAAPAASVSPTAPVESPIHRRSTERLKTQALEWPVEYAGKLYEDIVVRRMTTAEVAGFIEQMESSKGVAFFRFPMFYHPDGTRLPDGLIDQLDDDDVVALTAVAADFLPRRFVTHEPESGTPPKTGDTTAGSSAE
jgi:hypothetical protein